MEFHVVRGTMISDLDKITKHMTSFVQDLNTATLSPVSFNMHTRKSKLLN